MLLLKILKLSDLQARNAQHINQQLYFIQLDIY